MAKKHPQKPKARTPDAVLDKDAELPEDDSMVTFTMSLGFGEKDDLPRPQRKLPAPKKKISKKR